MARMIPRSTATFRCYRASVLNLPLAIASSLESCRAPKKGRQAPSIIVLRTLEAEYDEAEAPSPFPLTKLGDSIDLGPVYSYLYMGTWKQGAFWLREKRQHLPFRQSPAQW